METYPIHSLASQQIHKVESEDPENVFKLEIESWCYGLFRFPGELSAKLIHALIREMSGSFLYAVKNHFAFSLVWVAKQLHKASEGIVNEKELALHIIACMPNPASLNSDEFAVFEQVITEAKKVYPDVVQRFESRLSKARAKQ